MPRNLEHQSGFTLIEVLVALVISAFLMVILMDGQITAQQRVSQAIIKQESLSLATQLIEQHIAAAETPSMEGETKRKLRWQITEQVIASDPRERYDLVSIKVDVSPAKGATTSLRRTFLRPRPVT